MDSLYLHFGVSGVETWFFLPPLVALVVSTLTSMGGISGAFLLLPFQVSVLGFDTPAVSATNFVYNIVAIPSGVYRYMKEGRMAWPLTWIVIVGNPARRAVEERVERVGLEVGDAEEVARDRWRDGAHARCP